MNNENLLASWLSAIQLEFMKPAIIIIIIIINEHFMCALSIC